MISAAKRNKIIKRTLDSIVQMRTTKPKLFASSCIQ